MANIIPIVDLDDPKLTPYVKLTEAQLRNRLEPENGLLIAESLKVIRVALQSGYIPQSFLMENTKLDGQGRELIQQFPKVPVFSAERHVVEQLTGYQLSRGILCAMKRPPLPVLSDVISNANRIVVLEGVVDATNIGAIFRSAAALNMDAVLVTPTCCDPFNRRSVRVSMGTVFQIPWTCIGSDYHEWPHPGLDWLHDYGFKTLAMALRNDTISIDSDILQREERLAIIMGTEGDGLSEHTIANCDYTVCIPMAHHVDSLNVAAASAVAFWQLGKRN